MRTNGICSQVDFQPEFARRIKKLRLALGYRRAADLAVVLGFSQQQMSNWERGAPRIKQWEAVVDRIAMLARYLKDPVEHATELGKIAETDSPILEDPDGLRAITEAVCDWNVSPEEWDERLAGMAWANSNAPFHRSKLLEEVGGHFYREGFSGLYLYPDIASILYDLQTHGEGFVLLWKASLSRYHIDSLATIRKVGIRQGFSTVVDSLGGGDLPTEDRDLALAWGLIRDIFERMRGEDGLFDSDKARITWSIITSHANAMAEAEQEISEAIFELPLLADDLIQTLTELVSKRSSNA